jgi:hypothetical protein
LRTKKLKPPQRGAIAGIVHANVQLPASLHESMKAIRQVRHEQEGSDIKLCRIYREAVEQYINSKPQQRLLNGLRNTA